jgi:4-hydroxy 2-oxovalerate aldolase
MRSQKIHIVDTTLRDGSHAVSHSFTCQQAADISGGLDKVGVDLIECSHGDGIAGSSFNYGFNKTPELDLIAAARKVIKKAKLVVLLLPGIGTIEDLKKVKDIGVDGVRVATHCTEADISIQHITWAKQNGMFACGFLMMSHMASPEKLVEQARIMVDAGADYINIADSAGHMVPDDVKARIAELKASQYITVPVGFHAHANLGLAIANSLVAIQEGAEYIDATCRGLGAGAGNAQNEVLCSVLQRLGWNTGVDIYALQDLAEDVVEPIMQRPQTIKTDSLMLGYAGVYSSFLLHARRASEKFGISTRDILVELGRRRMVGGQEDMIVDVAYELSQKKKIS